MPTCALGVRTMDSAARARLPFAHSVIWPMSRFTLRPTIASIRATLSFTASFLSRTHRRTSADAHRGRQTLRSALEDLGGVFVVKLLHEAARDRVGAPRVQELLPRHVAVAHHPSVGAFVERLLRVDDRRPFAVALCQRPRLGGPDDPCSGPAAANRLRRHPRLP